MKVALVSSLAYRPQLLILDEPFSGLDPLVREEFIDGILEITENEHWTIFISSHDIDEVERLADRVAIVDHGTLKISEETESLQKRFRKIQITLTETTQKTISIPEEWFLFKQEGRVVCFIDSQYVQGKSENKIHAFWPQCLDVTVTGLTLREIFIACAKKFKITHL